MSDELKLFGAKRYRSPLGNNLTEDILERLRLDVWDNIKPEDRSEDRYEAQFILKNEGILYKQDNVYFIEIREGNSNHGFVIKKIDDREIRVDKGDIDEDLENTCDSLSFVELNGNEVNISEVFKGEKRYGIDRLKKMLQEYVREESENKKRVKPKKEKNKDIKNNGFYENENENCFGHNMDIDEDSI
jgi:hypothetical protein